MLWWFGGFWGGWGGGVGIIDSIPILSTLLFFFRRLKVIIIMGLVVEICSYYDCSHAELLFFMFLHVLCFCFTFIASWVVD